MNEMNDSEPYIEKKQYKLLADENMKKRKASLLSSSVTQDQMRMNDDLHYTTRNTEVSYTFYGTVGFFIFIFYFIE